MKLTITRPSTVSSATPKMVCLKAMAIIKHQRRERRDDDADDDNREKGGNDFSHQARLLR